ncbi:class I SAM-dependent methyltransferase [Candidatus Parcubacteria bacterium]|nr:MAG: class I SAM-dependent methyltransferase [Candidatus Parcubacteria bacterium]
MGLVPENIAAPYRKTMENFAVLVSACGTAMDEFHYHSSFYLHGIVRDMELFKKFSNHTKRILDVGCGSGMISGLLREHADACIGIDVPRGEDIFNVFKKRRSLQSQLWKKIGNQIKVSYLYYNGTCFPFKDSSFDAVVLYAVIEHVENDCLDAFLKEIHRILEPNGLLYIARTPRKLALLEYFAKYLGLGAHRVLFGDREMVCLLSRYGFKIEYQDRTDMLFSNVPYKPLQRVYNALQRAEVAADTLLSILPTNLFSHNMRIIAKKS